MTTKSHRLAEFQRRLMTAVAADSFDAAYGQIFRILNEVEDELSGIPYNVKTAATDGRLYPPLWDNIRRGPSRSRVTRLRSRSHLTLVGDNGSIEVIEILSGQTVFEKAGSDGVKVSQL
jgi:hypothetical protein